MKEPVNEVASRHSYLEALPPNPRNFSLCRQNELLLGSGLRPLPAHSGRRVGARGAFPQCPILRSGMPRVDDINLAVQ